MFLSVDNALAQGTVATDRAALVALYDATGGSSWTTSTNWKTTEPLSEWHGVTTDPNGRVTGLSLSQNMLSGEIPEELGDLANLQWLYLDGNQLSGEIPEELGNLASLQRLYLSQNMLSGEIPEELGDLANLQHLYLYENALSGEIPEELGDLASLQRLYLYENELSGEIPEELGDLASLQHLYLYENELSGEIPEELGNLASLQRLSLSRNMLSGEIPEELGDLANLQYLYLPQNMLSGEIPEELGDLTNLQRLYLSQNMLSGEIPEELGDLTSLQYLYLYENELSGEIPSWLVNLTGLLELSLWSNQLTGTIPTGRAPAQVRAALVVLYNATDGANWTDNTNWVSFNAPLSEWHGVSTDEQGRVEELRLSANGLTGTIGAELGVLTHLTGLYLNDNELTGPIPPELANLTQLQVFDVRNTGLSCVTAGSELHTWLKTINSQGAVVCVAPPPPPPPPPPPRPRGGGGVATDRAALVALYDATGGANWTNSTNWKSTEALSEWFGVSTDADGRVTELSLWGNQLSGEIPVELGDLANLVDLYLYENGLSGEIPEELGDLTSLQRLYLHENELSGKIPVELGDLANLQRLYLSQNQLSGEIPVELGDLANLQQLWLNGNTLSGEIPVELGDLTSLQYLYLDGNELCGEIPAELGDLANLQRLYLNDNGLTGPIPPELANLANLQEFDVRNTGLMCVTAGSELHTWLKTINRGVRRGGAILCATTPPPPPPSPPPCGGGGGSGGGGEPRTSVPGAPRNLTAAGGDGEAVLSWDAPSSDGGSAITDYEYRINRSGPWIPIGSTLTTHTVTGLVNGTGYVFQVRAVNRVGGGRVPNQAEATPKAPEVLDFAHFANGDGTTSDLVFVNAGNAPVRPALYFYGTGGALVAAESVVDVTGDLTVQEDGGLTVLTAMEPLGELTVSTHGRGDLVSGSVKVISVDPLGGMLRFDLPTIGEAVVGASPPVRDALFAVRRQQGGITTGVAIHNLEAEAMEVSCELLQGGVLRDTVSLPLAANGQTSWLIDAAFPGADTSDFAGSVRCDAPAMFSAVALEMDPGTRVFLTLPLFPVNRRAGGPAASLDFAHFANGEGTTSDLVFLNVSTQRSGPPLTPFHTAIPPIRPAIYFYDTEGALMSAESVVDVTGDLEVTEDGGLTVLTEMEPLGVLTVSTHGQGALVSGSVKVVAEGPLGGMLRFDLPHVGVAVVGASPPVSDALFPVRRQEGGITTGVAVHNLDSSPGLVRCDLMREGVLLDAVPIPLAANGQTSWLIDQAFPGTDTSDFTGSVRCTAPGEGMFTGVAVELDAANRIFTTLPVVPVPERMSQE